MAPDRLKPALETNLPGCLWLLWFDSNGRAEAGTAKDLDRVGRPGEVFIWLHLDLTDNRTRSLIERLDALTEDSRTPFVEPVDHQFLEYSDGIVSGALLDHERDLSGRTTQTDFLRFAFGSNFLVSARRKPLNAVERTRLALSKGELTPSPLALFEALTEKLCDELSSMIDAIGITLDGIEDRIIEGRGRNERATLGPARRDAARLTRQIGGLNSILLRLENAVDADEHEELREAAARLAQRTDALTRDISSIQERARLLQDELTAILNLETNDRLYVLTVVTTLLLPATFITGYFGMNTKQLPFSESAYGSLYATILCACASLSVLLFMRRLGLTRSGDAGSETRSPASKPPATVVPPKPSATRSDATRDCERQTLF
jgi:zinc transporter